MRLMTDACQTLVGSPNDVALVGILRAIEQALDRYLRSITLVDPLEGDKRLFHFIFIVSCSIGLVVVLCCEFT